MGFVTYTTTTENLFGEYREVEVISGYAGEIGKILDLSQEKGEYIGSSAFEIKDIEKVILPNNLIAIGSLAFAACHNLSEVVFPEKLLSIGSSAFSVCNKIKKIDLPKGLKQIDSDAFSHCRNLSELSLPEELESIGSKAFSECENIKGNLYIPKSVMYIGRRAFENTRIETVYLPDTLRDIGEDAFPSDCELIQIPYDKYEDEIKRYKNEEIKKKQAEKKKQEEETKKIAEEKERKAAKKKAEKSEKSPKSKAGAEERKNDEVNNTLIYKTSTNGDKILLKAESEKIKNAIVPEGVVEIADNAFDKCENLETVQLPSTLKRIGKFAFSACSALKTITIPSSVEHIGTGAFCNSGISSITIQNGIKTIGRYAFKGMSISEIEIPDSVETIEKGAFGFCAALIRVTIGNGVQSIADSAFEDDQKLGYSPYSKVLFKDPTGWRLNKFSLIPKNWNVIFADPKAAAKAIYKYCGNLSGDKVAFLKK